MMRQDHVRTTLRQLTRVRRLLLGTGLGMAVLAAPPVGAAQTFATPEEWQEDLRFLVRELEARHPNLYHSMTEVSFKASADSLMRRVPDLTDAGVAAEMARLLARVGDGHTAVLLGWQERLFRHRLPIEFFDTGEDLVVIAADDSLADLIGARVLAFGETPAGEALDRIDALTSRDNPYTMTASREMLEIPALLHALKVIADPGRLRIRVEDRSGAERWVELETADRDSLREFRMAPPGVEAPAWLQRRDQPYWIAFLPDRAAAYLQYNNAWEDREDIAWADFCATIPDTLQAREVETLVIDLRWNAGGSQRRTDCLLHAAIRSEGVNRPGGLFVLINPNTFSAASSLAVDLDRHTEALFVGRPTGGAPNGYSQRGLFHLPNSGLEIRNSAYFSQHAGAGDQRPAVFPDRWAPVTVEAVRQGRDPALESALDYTPLPSYVESHLQADSRGLLEALAALPPEEAWRQARFEVSEAALNRLGYNLLGEGRTGEAIAVFKAIIDAFPWSANPHDSLGDAYRAAGEPYEALREYCASFAMNRDLRVSRENAVDLGGQEACELAPRGWAPLGQPWIVAP